MPAVTLPEVVCHEPEAEGLQEDQLRGFVKIVRLLKEGQRTISLTGCAGSGKTWLMTKIAQWADRNGFNVELAAPTHKAAGVISEKLARDGCKMGVKTIHSLLGLLLVPDWENDTGGRILVSQVPEMPAHVKPDIHPVPSVASPSSQEEFWIDDEGKKRKRIKPLVIVDEASMLGRTLKEHIDATTKRSMIQWLFVGDLAQLPPVGEGTSALLRNPDVTLRTVLRQAAGSEIIMLANRIRHGDLSMTFLAGKDVMQVAGEEELFQAALKEFATEAHHDDPSHARMLVFRNAKRIALNQRAREALIGPPSAVPPFVKGEWLTMCMQHVPSSSRLNQLRERALTFAKGDPSRGPAWRAFYEEKEEQEAIKERGIGLDMIHTSEDVRIMSVGSGRLTVGGVGFAVWNLHVLTRDDEVFQMPVLKEESRPDHQRLMDAAREDAIRIREEMNLLELRGFHRGDLPWEEANVRRKRCWQRFYVLEETFAWVDRCYALTTHRAQGSTFGHAFLDVPDLLASGGMQKPLLYTAATRPSDSLTFFA